MPKYGALIQFIPDFYSWNTNSNGEMIKTGSQFDTENYDFLMRTTKAEFIFVLDRSGSMGVDRMNKAKNALIKFLESLPPNSYFNVVSFGSQNELLFAESVSSTPSNINTAKSKISEFTSNLGGTEIYAAVKVAVELAAISRYQRIVFLLTDGSISNTEYFLQNVKQTFFYGEARMFAIGIGNGVSTYLVQQAAEFGGGKSIIISDSEDPTSRVLALL